MAISLGGIEARRAEWLRSRLRLPTFSLQAHSAVLFATGLLAIGFVAWFATDLAASVNSDSIVGLRAGTGDLAALQVAMLEQDAALRGYAASGDTGYLPAYGAARTGAADAEQQLHSDLSGTTWARRVQPLRTAAGAWMAWAAAERAAVDAGGPAAVTSADLARGHALFDAYAETESAFAGGLGAAVDGADGRAADRRHADSVGMALAASAAVVNLLLLLRVLLVQVARPVSQLAATAAALARDGDAEVAHTDRRDEIGALAHALLDWRYASAERLAMAKLAAESEARFRTVFEHAPIGVCRMALNGRILDTNRTLQEMLGYSAEHMARLSIGDLSHPDDRARLQDLHDQRVDRFVIERRYLRSDGSVFWGLMTVALARMQDGRPLVYVAMVEDITERKEREQRLHTRASTDALTGLGNRTTFLEAVAATLADRRIHRSAVLMLDLDGFKQVNDTHGHAAGDELLRQVGQRMAEVVRTSDVVARLGGDEFAILLPGTDSDGAGVAARKVLAALARPFDVGGRTVRVGGSIGIALAPEHAQSIEELLERADVAMYRAKRAGTGLEVAA